MIAWLKLNKFKIVGTVITIVLFIVNSYFSGRYMYNRAIKASDRVIMEIKQGIKDSDSRADVAIKRAEEAEKEAKVARVEKEKHKANVARIEKEKQGLEKKIAVLPPTQVVVHLVKILYVESEEITLQSQGILFSLAAGRKTLRYMEEFTLLRQQFDELAMAFVRSELSGIKLLEANIKKTEVLIEKDSQLLGWEKAEIEWFNKFSLSENRGKSNWWRGIKTGAAVGGVIAFFAGFFLAK